MPNKEVSLDSIMDRTPRTGNVIDVTTGKITEPAIVNDDKTTVESVTFEDPEVKEEPVRMRADVVENAGPIDTDNVQTLDIHSILPKREESNPLEDDLMSKLDAAVDKEMESITERVDAITAMQRKEFEEMKAKELEKEQEEQDAFALNNDITNSNTSSDGFSDEDTDYSDDDDDEEEATSTLTRTSVNIDSEKPTTPDKVEAPKPTIKTVGETESEKVSVLDGVDDDHLFDDEDDDDSSTSGDNNEDVNAMIETLKGEVKEKITPIRKSFDLTKFTIARKSMNASKVLKLAVKNHQNVADWVLYSADRPVSVTGLSGPEILKLNPENSTRNRLNTFKDMYNVIYNHIYDGNKPEYEAWLKQTRFVDLQHIYFALYMATFNGTNFITYTCPKCNKVFIQDVKFEDMVKYADDETKDKVRSILKRDSTSPSDDSYPVDLVQISNDYVFGLRTPSIYSVIIETASLSDKFIEKYSDMIDLVSYIDAIYYIDEESLELVPIDIKEDPNDQAKTSARRIRAYYDIISSLNSEDFYNLRARIAEYDDSSNKLEYYVPGCKCPQCGEDIPDNNDMTPDNMLFTRHQLAAIGNM